MARRSAARIELRRLTTDELATMTSMCLGAEVDASVMSLIDDFADGLPLLVEELLTTSVADGTITSSADGWRVGAAGVPAVPERFAELVRRRMGALDEDAAQACRVGAVLGQRFDTELLRTALGTPIESVARGLRAGVRAQPLASTTSCMAGARPSQHLQPDRARRPAAAPIWRSAFGCPRCMVSRPWRSRSPLPTKVIGSAWNSSWPRPTTISSGHAVWSRSVAWPVPRIGWTGTISPGPGRRSTR